MIILMLGLLTPFRLKEEWIRVCRIKFNRMKNQSSAPFYEALHAYIKNPVIGFHTPGHRGGLSLGEEWQHSEGLLDLDLTEISGLEWKEALEAAESLAADFYHADRSVFLVQGATQGILASLLGCFKPGDTVLVGRNCHVSVINGLILADLIPVFLETDWLDDWEIPAGVNIGSLKKAIENYPELRGFILTNPTYQGIASSLKQYRDIIGDRILIVDEAHGGHLGWCGFEGFDAHREADLWVQGTHKALGSLTQTGLLHFRQGRINIDNLQNQFALISTTSPSFILLSSLDVNRRFLATGGAAKFYHDLDRVKRLKVNLSKLKGIKVLGIDETINGETDIQRILDPWKITVSLLKLGLSGFKVEQVLLQKYQIQAEYADYNQVTLFVAPWQPEGDLERLFEAFQDITQEYSGFPLDILKIPRISTSLRMRPREAIYGTTSLINIKKASGKIAAGTIAPYPPGIPLVIPGEEITPSVVEFVLNVVDNGGFVRGMNHQQEILISCKEDLHEQRNFHHF